MRCAKHVACIGENRNVHSVLVSRIEGTRERLGHTGVGWSLVRVVVVRTLKAYRGAAWMLHITFTPRRKERPARQRGGWMDLRVSLEALEGEKKLFFLMGIKPRVFRYYTDWTQTPF